MLLRARAIENGCFVVAPDQVGEHLPGRDCFGHSMIVDPWGAVLAEVEDGVGICVADLDLARLDEVRGADPVAGAPPAGRLRPLSGRGAGLAPAAVPRPGSGRGGLRGAPVGEPAARERDDDAR